MRFNYISARRVLAMIGSLSAHFWIYSNLGIAGFPVSGDSTSYDAISYFQVEPISAKSEEPCPHSFECSGNNDTHAKGGTLPTIGNATDLGGMAVDDNEPSAYLDVAYYYKHDELSQVPKAQTDPNIRIPESDDPRIIGSVTLRLFLSERGSVDDIAVKNVTLPEEYVKEIVSAYKLVQFMPGELNGAAVKSQVEFEVSFLVDPKPINMSRRGS